MNAAIYIVIGIVLGAGLMLGLLFFSFWADEFIDRHERQLEDESVRKAIKETTERSA